MLNNWTGTGRLTKQPELRYTQTGVAVLSYTLAVDRTFKNANGEKETDFIMCVAFRKTAEIMAEHLNKGSLIGVTGRVQTRNYENNQGQRVYVTEIVTDNFVFLESKNQSNQNNQQNTTNNQQKQTNKPDDNPFANIGADDNPFETNDDAAEIDDDSLPF